MDEGSAKVALAAVTVATLWLSLIVALRGMSDRMPAVALAALWISVIGVGLISDGRGPRVTDGRGDGITAALAGPAAAAQAQVGALLEFAASGDGRSLGNGQSVAVRGGPDAASPPLRRGGGRCASPGPAGADSSLLAAGIFPSAGGGGPVFYPKRACGPESRITTAGVGPSSPDRGLYAGSQGSSLDSQGSATEDGGQERSEGAGDAVGKTVKKPVGGTGDTANAVGNTVNAVGNTVNSVGHTVKKPVRGTVTTVGNIVNAVTNAVKKP
ncbi:MAG: hypothetical protein M3M99_03730 [Actinomycetota bacterium]|nr:hypothetical protein [Actinomycetota bacterium]